MTATITELRPFRTLKLPCTHEQKSAANAGSSIDCKTCRRHVKISARMIAEADGTLKHPPTASRARRSPGVATPTTSAGPWRPVPIPWQTHEADPGSCPECGTARAWTGRATLTYCPRCETASLAPATLRAHSRAAGPQQARDAGERDIGNRELYRQVQELLDDIADALRQPGLDSEERGDLAWLRDELLRARRDRNTERLGELATQADDILTGLPDDGDDEDDPGDLDPGPDAASESAGSIALEDRNVSPAAWSAYFARTVGQPGPFTPNLPARTTRRPAPPVITSTGHREPEPEPPPTWLKPARLGGEQHPLVAAADQARVRMQQDGKQLADILARGKLTGRQLAEATGNEWQPREPAAGPRLVHDMFHNLAGQQTGGTQPRRSLAVRIVGGLTAGNRGLPAGSATDRTATFWQRYDVAQAEAWRR